MKITLAVEKVENGEIITVISNDGFQRTHVREEGSYSALTIRAKLADIVREEYDRSQEAEAKASKTEFTHIAENFQAKMAELVDSQRIDAILGIQPTAESTEEPL